MIQESQSLNEEHKRLKQLAMERLMGTFAFVFNENPDVQVDLQAATDLIISCVIMFCRNTLSHFFLNSNALNDREMVMTDIFETIKQGVEQRIKETMDENRRNLN